MLISTLMSPVIETETAGAKTSESTAIKNAVVIAQPGMRSLGRLRICSFTPNMVTKWLTPVLCRLNAV